MLAPIPWERYSGETVEKTIATYICRLHPSATRIRPSQGDHGIDLIDRHNGGTVTVYQIKKFASNLQASQKRQIKDSLSALLYYLEDNRIVLREWHLVMPLDPTLENLEWFDELAPDSSFKMIWDGLTVIDGWAAQMPEVADYCLNGNSGWVMDLARMHLDALDIEDDGGRNRVMQRLSAVQEILEKTDSNYRYGIKLVPEYVGEMDTVELMESSQHQPNLLMTHMYEQPDGGFFQIDVYARSAELAEQQPIKGKVTFLPKDEDERRQVEEFIGYGVPIKSCTARIVETSGPFASEMNDDSDEGVLCILPHEIEQAAPEVYLTTEAGNELALFRTSRTSGEKGIQTIFTDGVGVLSMTLRMDYEGGIAGTPQISTEGIERKDCSAVRASLAFLSAAYKSGEVSILWDDKVVAVWTLQPNDELSQSIDALYELASAVEAIGNRANASLLFPKIDDMTVAEHASILAHGELAAGKCIVKRWREAPFKMVANEEMNLECPAIIKWLKPEKTTIAGIECDLGYSENVIVVGSVRQSVGDGAITFLPRDLDGDVCIKHLLPTRSAAVGMTDQVYSTPFEEEIWAETLRFAGYNQIDTSC